MSFTGTQRLAFALPCGTGPIIGMVSHRHNLALVCGDGSVWVHKDDGFELPITQLVARIPSHPNAVCTWRERILVGTTNGEVFEVIYDWVNDEYKVRPRFA